MTNAILCEHIWQRTQRCGRCGRARCEFLSEETFSKFKRQTRCTDAASNGSKFCARHDPDTVKT